jgi:hypothetical protein
MFKLEVVDFMKEKGNREAARKFNVGETSVWEWRYTFGGKMSDKNLLQRINIKFCVKIGKSASGTLALLTLAYG